MKSAKEWSARSAWNAALIVMVTLSFGPAEARQSQTPLVAVIMAVEPQELAVSHVL